MKKIIIDSRMRKEEKEYLYSIGYELLELEPHKELYAEISSHPDIQIANIKGNLICASNSNFEKYELICGESKIESKYPKSVPYNVCIIGNYIIHNFKFTDKKILDLARDLNLIKINVNQGYSKCSIAVTSNNSCITTDFSIYRKLLSYKIDCLYINENNIHLLDKDGKISKMKGFIGGATAILDDKFIIFGDRQNLNFLKEVEEHLNKYNLKFIDFSGLPIYDYGGIIAIK